MKGYVHKIESMGLVDGPGVRAVVFLSGCPLRCCYCHNPDAWRVDGTQMEAVELVSKLLRCRSYFESSGGVTISGGEPLVQKDFLLEVLRLLKGRGIHTCLDTSGSVGGDFGELLRYTDLILYDVKETEAEAYRRMTGGELSLAEDFLRQAQQAGVPLWLRHVVVPGMTDSEAHMLRLRSYIEPIQNVRRVELLPYHKMGVYKYEAMGLCDPLKGTIEMDQNRCNALQEKYFGCGEKESACYV